MRAIDVAEAARLVGQLARGDGAERAWAAYLATQLDSPIGLGFVLALSSDTDHRVRAAAARAAARFMAESPDEPVIREMFNAALKDPGTRVPFGIADTLADIGTDTARALLEPLSDHASAAVRRIVREARSSRAP
jgi:HEAT repeat protein